MILFLNDNINWGLNLFQSQFNNLCTISLFDSSSTAGGESLWVDESLDLDDDDVGDTMGAIISTNIMSLADGVSSAGNTLSAAVGASSDDNLSLAVGAFDDAQSEMSDASDDSDNDDQSRRQRLRKIYVDDDYESNLEVEVEDDGNCELGRAGDLVQSSNDLVWVLGRRYFYIMIR